MASATKEHKEALKKIKEFQKTFPDLLQSLTKVSQAFNVAGVDSKQVNEVNKNIEKLGFEFNSLTNKINKL